MAQKWRIFNVPFEGMTETANINDLMPYKSTVAIDWQAPTADRPDTFQPYAPQIQIMDADGHYEYYFYVTNARYKDENGQTAYKPGWCYETGALALESNAKGKGMLTPGAAAVWFCDPNNDERTITTAGGVRNADVEIECQTGWRLRGPSIPATFNLNDSEQVSYIDIDNTVSIDWQAPTADRPDTFQPYAPQIQIMDADGHYEYYFYVTNARYKDENGQTAYKPGWCYETGALALESNAKGKGVVDVNYGFWLKGVSKAFTMKFKGLAK